MKLSIVAMLATTLATTACHFRRDDPAQANAETTADPADPAATPLAAGASQATLCASIAGESAAGIQAMDVALIGSFSGRMDRQRAGRLTRTGDYTHQSSEMVAGHCWTRAQFKNDPHDPVGFQANWRCPVTLVTDAPKAVGQTLVDDVDSSSCEFNAAPGAPPAKAVTTQVRYLPS